MAPPSKRPVRRVSAPVEETGEEVAASSNGQAEEPEEDEDGVAIRGGWTDAQAKMDSTSSFAQTLKLEEKSKIIAFLEETPYANFRRHWIERSSKEEGKSMRAYTCLVTVGKECPLCEIGDRAQAVAAFNVAEIGDDGQILVRSWDVGPRLFNVLKAYANDPKIAPLGKGFFVASKTGKRGTTQHNISPVSRTALREDYDIEPPSREALDALVKYTPKIIEIPKLSTLKELAAELADDYE